MTRLVSEWLKDMEDGCARRDLELQAKTGMSLAALAAKACGMLPSEFRMRGETARAAAVPITSGLGVIGDFAESVAVIVGQAGACCRVAGTSDVNGIYEAREDGAEIIFMADDDRFLALDVVHGTCGENNRATAMGYAQALMGMAELRGESPAGTPALVLGGGPVGTLAAEALEKAGWDVHIMDKDPAKNHPFRMDEIKQYRYVLEATPEGGWLDTEMLHPEAAIAAPGIPLGLTGRAAEAFKDRLVHDMLDIGTAVMLALVLQSPGEERK